LRFRVSLSLLRQPWEVSLRSSALRLAQILLSPNPAQSK
jgi:hypothetical protein